MVGQMHGWKDLRVANGVGDTWKQAQTNEQLARSPYDQTDKLKHRVRDCWRSLHVPHERT